MLMNLEADALVVSFSKLETIATGFRRRLSIPLDKIVSATISSDPSELPGLLHKVFGTNLPHYLAGTFRKDGKSVFIVSATEQPFLLIKTSDYHYPTVILTYQPKNDAVIEQVVTYFKDFEQSKFANDPSWPGH